MEKDEEGEKKAWLTWCTNTSTGISKGLPSRFIMEMNPNPMRTLNHLQWPVPRKTWDSSSAGSGSFPGSSPPPLLAPPEKEQDKKVSLYSHSMCIQRFGKKKKLPAWECRGRVTKKHFFKMVWFLFSYRKYLKYKGLKGKRGRGKPHCSIDHTNFHVSIHTCSFSFNSIFQPHFTLQHAILYLYIADLILIPLTKRNFQQNYSLRRARGGKRNREDGLELLVKAHGAAVNPALFAMCIPLPPITFN